MLQLNARGRKATAARHGEIKLQRHGGIKLRRHGARSGNKASVGRRRAGGPAKTTKRAECWGRRDFGVCREIGKGRFCKIAPTSLNSGRREYSQLIIVVIIMRYANLTEKIPLS
jgi:hypothetical protein